MAVINPINAQRSIDIGGIPSTQIDDSIGRGLQQMGGAVSQHADRLIEIKRQDQAFAEQQRLNRWNDDNALEFAKLEEGIAVSGEGFADTSSSVFTKRSEEFLRDVPPELQPRMQELVATAREQWVNRGIAKQIDQRNTWFDTTLTERANKLQGQVFNDPNQFQASKDAIFREIDASDLPVTLKDAKRKQAEEMLALAVGEREIRNAEADPASSADAATRLGVPSAGVGNAKRFLLTKTDKDDSHIAGLQDSFASKLATLIQSAPPEIRQGLGIYSGARSNARQAELYEQAVAKYGSPEAARKWVAPPGRSNHNHGNAADLSYNGQSLKNAPKEVVEWVHSNAGRFGLKFPLANENWHIEDSSTRRGKHVEGEATSSVPDISTPADPRFANLTLSQRLSLYDQMQEAAKRGQTVITAQNNAAYDAKNSALLLGIQENKITSAQQVYAAGLKDSETLAALKALETRQKDNVLTADAVAAFQNGTLKVDPYSSDDRKKVDAIGKMIDTVVPADQQQANIEKLVSQTGSVPESVVNRLRAGAESQSASDVEAALQAASRFAQINPAALGRREGGDAIQRKVDDFDYYVNTLNLDPSDAARRIAEQNDPNKVRDRKALEPAAREFRKQLEGADIGAMFDDSFMGWRSNPNVGFTEGQAAGIAADYLAIAEEQFYLTSGNSDLAKSRAEQEMKRLYGVSEIGGSKTIMKYPPEKYWPGMPGESDPYAYAKDQLINDLAEAFPDDPLLNPKKSGSGFVGTVNGRTVDIRDRSGLTDYRSMVRDTALSRIVLVATPETGAEAKSNQLPGYTVLYKDENGNLQTLYGKQWRPDPQAVVNGSRRQQQDRMGRAEIYQQAGQGVADYLAGGEIPMGAGTAWDNPEVQQTAPAPAPSAPVPTTVSPTIQSGLQDQRSQLFQNAQQSGILTPGGM